MVGDAFGIVGAVTNSAGEIETGYTGDATLSLSSGPTGASFNPVTVPLSNGMAVFAGLSLSRLSGGTDFVFQIAVTGLAPASTTGVDAIAKAAGVTNLYPLPFDAVGTGSDSLRRALGTAGDDANAQDVITLSTSSIPYNLTGGQLVVSTTLASKTISIVGQGESSSVITAGGNSRVIEIDGTGTNLVVNMRGLGIEDGTATAASSGSGPAEGGALLIDGGAVMLSNVALSHNAAVGLRGADGSPGHSDGSGLAGAVARGGAIYLAGGNLTLTDDLFDADVARGGAGGAGAPGGAGGSGGGAQGALLMWPAVTSR